MNVCAVNAATVWSVRTYPAGACFPAPRYIPQELWNVHVTKKDVHIDSRTSRAMGGGAQVLPRGRAALQHAGHVSVLVSKLAPPSGPRQEAALWAIAPRATR